MSKQLIGIILAVVAGFVALTLFADGGDQDGQTLLRPVDSFQHGHGMAVDVADSNKVYIATHNGLFMLQNDTELYQVGSKTHDYMGFSPHPTDPETFYTSGHPKTGGNLGIQRTTDGGRSWEALSSGANGPVDFHAMTVSKANPELMYGWYAGNLQRSKDGGEQWSIVDANLDRVINLVSHPSNERIVYAATASGIQKSADQGETWSDGAPDLQGAVVTALAINPSDSDEWISYSEKSGFAKSNDSGQTWQGIMISGDNQAILHIAYDPNDPDTIYALTQGNNLYKTANGGQSWQKVR